MKFKFSIIMSIYNVEEYIEEAIDSLINQTLDFKSNIELILVNDGSTDDSKNICLKYKKLYPNNITLINKKNGGLSSARNCGLKYATGEYVNFFDPDDILSKNTLKNVYKFFKQNEHEIDFVSIPIEFFGKKNGKHPLDYKFKTERVINLNETPEYPQLSVASSFFKRDIITEYPFKEGLATGEDALTINKILLEKKKYGVINGVTYWYRQRYDDSSMIGTAKLKKAYYTQSLKEYFLDLIYYSLEKEGYIPKFIQYMIIYDLKWLIKIKDLPEFLIDDELEEFWKTLYELLDFIDIDIIKNHLSISDNIKRFIIFLKNMKDFKIYNKGNIVKFYSGDIELTKLNNNKLWLDLVKFDDNYLYISGFFKSLCYTKNLSIKIIKTEIFTKTKEEYYGKFFEYPNRLPIRFLSYNWVYTYSFDFKIPIKQSEISKFDFKVEYSENDYHAIMNGHVKFNYPCELSEFNLYSLRKKGIILFENNSIYYKPYSLKRHLLYEFRTLKLLLQKRPESFFNAILFRLIYLLLYPIYTNKEIWLFSDRPYSADDNAMHLFKYCTDKKDHIKKYYVLKKDCPDYKKMLKISKNIIPYGSLRHKLYFAFSDKVISAFLNESFKNPFYKHDKLFSGLLTHKDYFLQHGVILHDLSAWIKKYDKDLSLIVTSSDFERDSFFKYKYNYDEEIIQTLGLSRYDTLDNKETKKIILLMPTWREYIQDKDSLINSNYFKSINSFINNEELITILQEYDYNIAFKPHPELWKYLEMDLFNINDRIIISQDISYQELLNQGALMITDYSSVFFDFAYLKKPIIYYQPSSFEDFHYNEGYFDYETMGFGELIKNEKELIEKIREYLKNNCKNEEKYIKRSDEFFKFSDKNNRKRIYEWIINH